MNLVDIVINGELNLYLRERLGLLGYTLGLNGPGIYSSMIYVNSDNIVDFPIQILGATVNMLRYLMERMQ